MKKILWSKEISAIIFLSIFSCPDRKSMTPFIKSQCAHIKLSKVCLKLMWLSIQELVISFQIHRARYVYCARAKLNQYCLCVLIPLVFIPFLSQCALLA